MNRQQHLAFLIGLYAMYLLVPFLVDVYVWVEAATQTSQSRAWRFAVVLAYPLLIAGLLVGRRRLAGMVLGAEAEEPVAVTRGLVTGGCLCMGIELLTRSIWHFLQVTDWRSVAAAAEFVAPTVLVGAVFVSMPRLIATFVTGER